jgi:hypothetical protein
VFVYHFVFRPLCLSTTFRFAASDYPFGIFELFFIETIYISYASQPNHYTVQLSTKLATQVKFVFLNV